jgi:prepilin-type N-terminal cleavage/methylation domain-containing protein
MKFTPHLSVRATPAPGFTLVEMMVAVAVTSLLFAALVVLGMFTTKSFSIMGNYVDLDAQSLNAADVLGRQVRNASALVAFSTNNPLSLTLTNATAGQTITITYSTNNSTLTLAQTGQTTQTLLTRCYSWNFSLYDRYPNITATNITFYPATNSTGQLDPTVCKVINLSWKCSRTILGTTFNTESVQTAQIVLRNQVIY